MTELSKYYSLLQINWQNGLVYKTNFLLWRFRQVITTLLPLAIWHGVFTNTSSFLGYSFDEMIAYILLGGFTSTIIFSTALHDLPGKVYSGELSNVLLKPIGLFKFAWITDIADKLKNTLFVVIELLFFWLIFQPQVQPPSLSVFSLFLLWLIFGILIHFYVEMLFGAIGFWSPDVWGPKFIFFIVVEISSGRLFPLDILPTTLQQILFLTPFPFFGFAQTQLLLNRLSSDQIWQISMSLIFWTIFLWLIAKIVWQKGLKDYASTGQ